MFAKFDQKSIDFLTMICWWTDVRWDKNNIFWVYQVDIFEMVLTIISWYLIGHFSTFVSVTFLSYVFLAYALIRLTLLVFAKEFYLNGVLSRYPQGFPNFCRISTKHTKERCNAFFLNTTSLIVLFLVWQLTSFFKDYPAAFIFSLYVAMTICSTIYYYLLACDSIPPQEKQRRIEKIEVESGMLQPIQISVN